MSSGITNINASVVDYNSIVLSVDVHLDFQTTFTVYAQYDRTPISYGSPSFNFVDYTGSGQDFTFNFEISGLLYDTVYYYGVELYDLTNQSTIDYQTDTAQTDPSPAYIANHEIIILKNLKARINADMFLRQGESYNVLLLFKKRSSQNNPITIIMDYLGRTGLLYNFTALLKHLKPKTEYEITIELRVGTTNQLIDSLTDYFIMEDKNPFPLWMYLHYFI